MSFFNALQLLTDVAHEYQRERETFSTAEITARINEIKYLSAQKKVPKLSLRKEIVHLENKLATVVDIEQRLAKHKKQDSVKEKTLKGRIKELQSRLAAAEDKDMQKKLDHLSQLLGDYLAKKTTEEEVKAAIAELKLVQAEKIKPMARGEPETVLRSIEVPANMQPRIKELQQRLEMLKGELELLRILKKDSRAKGVAEKIVLLGQKLNEYVKPEVWIEEKIVEPVLEKKEIKHTLLFEALPSSELPPDKDLELEKELPLPPPPRIKK